MQNRKRDSDVQNRLLDSVGEGEGGMFWENNIETSILSRVKQITSPGGIHETSAQGWCTGRPRGIGWRGRWEGGSGCGTHVNPWLIHVNVWQKPLQYYKVTSLQLIKINGKKKNKEPTTAGHLRDEGSILGSGRSLGEENGNPLQYSCLENPMGRGAWRATVHRVAKSWTRLKRLSTISACDTSF